jgi:hypothetical protein
MMLAGLLGMWVIVISVTASHAQFVLPTIKPPDETTISNIQQSARDRFYSERRIARRKNTPRVVFVPGILGSKIDECKPDGSQCINIWGTPAAVGRSGVDLSRRQHLFQRHLRRGARLHQREG